jgi:hypothetical protein
MVCIGQQLWCRSCAVIEGGSCRKNSRCQCALDNAWHRGHTSVSLYSTGCRGIFCKFGLISREQTNVMLCFFYSFLESGPRTKNVSDASSQQQAAVLKLKGSVSVSLR